MTTTNDDEVRGSWAEDDGSFDAMARVVVQNALSPHPFGLGWASVKSLLIPRCTFTDPEVAGVGLTEIGAREKGIRIETMTLPFSEIDRAVLDGETDGFVRIHLKKGSDRILGASIVAPRAGEMIGEIVFALRKGMGLSELGRTLRPYPTRGEILGKIANTWRKRSLTRGKKAILKNWFAWKRS